MRKKRFYDIEIPLDIKSIDLLAGLNEAFHLGLTEETLSKSFLICEDPVCLLCGDEKLTTLGVRNGSLLRYTR